MVVSTDVKKSVCMWCHSHCLVEAHLKNGRLEKILEVKGDFKVRIGMMNPCYAFKMLDDLIEIYKNEKIIKFLHIPIQSGSDKVLKEMNRIGTVEQFEFIVKKFLIDP